MRPAHHTVSAVALAVLCLLAGCGYFAGSTPTAEPSTATETPAPTDGATPTPVADRLGWEAGYSYDDPLPVNASDGLNASEREAVVARTMARVELLRGLDFTESVPVEVISREAYQERNVTFVERRDPRVTEQFWEALFLVGEDENATEVVGELFGGGVVGYYTPAGGGRIVLVSDDDSPLVDTGTLAHELVHAVQDQHFERIEGRSSFDARVAAQGLTEGDPQYVEGAYRRRCGGEWSCLPGPPGTGGDTDAIVRHPGVYLAFVQPYVSGPSFVEALRDRSDGNWTAVNDAYAAPPTASEQVIYPAAYPDERPVNVTVPDRSSADWTPVGREVAGEAGVHAMFWENGLVPRGNSQISTDYRNRRSAGWDGDTLVAYTAVEGSASDTDGDGSSGYVWRLVWENETEAREFQRSYDVLLKLRHGAREVAPGTYVVQNGSFADAFRVTRTDGTVTIVNVPTVEALSEVHAP